VTRHLVPVLPVAVYGTLRVGQPNADLWDGKAVASTGWAIRGYRLVGAGRGFPYAVPADEDEKIVVDLLALYTADAVATLARLDRLEGVPHHYDRVLAAAERHPRDGRYDLATVWLYVPVHAEVGRWGDPIPSGDWVAHVGRDLDGLAWR
jgi:gamma-glutamylcyclotransferase (GGCT)/AIG2-like uncharacterized protein YtfP